MGFQLGESFSFCNGQAIKLAIVLKLNISNPDRVLLSHIPLLRHSFRAVNDCQLKLCLHMPFNLDTIQSRC